MNSNKIQNQQNLWSNNFSLRKWNELLYNPNFHLSVYLVGPGRVNISSNHLSNSSFMLFMELGDSGLRVLS